MTLLQPLPINPGGELAPDQILGREALVGRLWSTLEQQSVLLAAERRMGKTSVLRKMEATAEDYQAVAIVRSVEDCSSPAEFVHQMLAALRRQLPRRHQAASALQKLAEQLGISVDVAGVGVAINPQRHKTWKEDLERLFEIVGGSTHDRHIVLLIDELPYMLLKVKAQFDEATSRDILDNLRAFRSRYSGLRMVLSGSVGLHHVLSGLRDPGIAWAPVNDMYIENVSPLTVADAILLAKRLLVGTTLRCDSTESIAAEIAKSVDCVPYYIHHTVKKLWAIAEEAGHSSLTSSDVRPVVSEAIASPLDEWNLRYLAERVESYYGDRRVLANAILDALATAPGPVTLRELKRRVDGLLETSCHEDELRRVLTWLQLDHYLAAVDGRGGINFRLSVVQRAWRVARFLSDD